jgi:hypothetical protein
MHFKVQTKLTNKINIFIIFLLSISQGFGQTDSTAKTELSAYLEVYYSFDFSEPENNQKPNFTYNHRRHNEVQINMLQLKYNYVEPSKRATVALMAGNYAQYNLSAEPTWVHFINEASIGVRLSKKYNLWLDAGIMPSHIGFESAISADCWTLTRSVLAENSPYFETGVKFGYTSKNEKLFLSALLLNGWQNVFKKPNHQYPAAGMQCTYKPNSNLVLNYSNFFGSVQPDSLNALRTYHNIWDGIKIWLYYWI